MVYKFDYVIIGGGPAGCVLANFLSKSNKVALIDIASLKMSDENRRFFPPFITFNKRPYSPAFSGVLGGNSDLWSGKIYLISDRECKDWPIDHDDILFFSKSLARKLNLNHENIYNIEINNNTSFYHRSKRSRLRNVFDTFSIQNNPNISVFPLSKIQNFEFDKNYSKIKKVIIKSKKDTFNIEITKNIIVTAGGLGSIPIIHQALINNPHLEYKKNIYPLHDHAHYSIKLSGGSYQNRLEKGYIKNNNSDFEDCLIFHKDDEMLAIQIDGGHTPGFIQKIRSLHFTKENIFLKKSLSILQIFNSLFNLITKMIGFNKTIPYEFFFSENKNSGKVEVIGNNETGYNLKVNYNENKDQKEKLFRQALTELPFDIGSYNLTNLPPPYVGLHPSGSVPMRNNYELGAVDKYLKVYGIDNMSTVGSHVFPQNGVTNPTWTVMTLAYRLAIYLTENNKMNEKNALNV